MNYTAIVEHVRDPATITCRCDNCDETASADSLLPIGDAILTPGDPSPAGRCFACNSLSYVDQPELGYALDLLRQLLGCAELNQDDLEPHTVVLIDSARRLVKPEGR